ncbi:hypothetical protein [Methanogenium sp. MK-MG]|uniref:hypothetical protein n=1 Tax=Methanogenium sp. MK-MG TaxID=2599926 RepID=UPI001C202421|nr:hypothetical protein [Methanogenium sp. MK-MG]
MSDKYERDVRAEEFNNTIHPANNFDISRNADVSIYSDKPALLESEIKKVIVGQENVIRQLFIAFAAGEYVLLEGHRDLW